MHLEAKLLPLFELHDGLAHVLIHVAGPKYVFTTSRASRHTLSLETMLSLARKPVLAQLVEHAPCKHTVMILPPN